MLNKEKEKFYLTIAAIFVIGIVLLWQGVLGSKALVDDFIKKINDKKLIIAAYDFKENDFTRTLENYNFTKNKIDTLSSYFVGEENFPEFIKELELTAEQINSKFEITEITETNPSDAKNNKEKKASAAKEAKKDSGKDGSYVIKVVVGGSLDQLVRFISKVESMPYYVYIDSVNINLDSGVDLNNNGLPGKKIPDGSIKAQLVIKVFKKQNFNDKK